MQVYTAVRLCLIQQHTIKAYVEVAVSFHKILTSTLGRGQWSALGSGCCIADEAAVVAHCKRGYVVSRTGLDAVEKIKPLSHARNRSCVPRSSSPLLFIYCKCDSMKMCTF